MNTNQRKARTALWNMVCAAAESPYFKIFTAKEYYEFIATGYLISYYTENTEYVSFMTKEEKILFFLFLYEAFPDTAPDFHIES